MRYRYYLITIFVFLFDHVTKAIVRSRMELHDSIEIIPNFFNFTYVRNSGVAFGLFSEIESHWKPYILAGMAVIAVIVILTYSTRIPPNRTLLHTSLAITLGGILGNFSDRVMDGFVVDFIELHLIGYFHWPTFNIADSAITCGIAMLLLDSVKNPEVEEKEAV